MSKKNLFLLLLFCSLSLLSCCSPKEELSSLSQDEQILRLNLHSEPLTLDPRLSRDIPSLTTGKMFFDGLMRRGAVGTPEPSIAKEIRVSEDKRHFTFVLRECLWSNGLPVTAVDFEEAWKKILAPDFPAENAQHLFVLKNGEAAKKGEISLDSVGVHALDAHTLEVELAHPDPYFLDLTASPICYPICMLEERINPDWATEQGERFICNGPFRLVKWEHGSELRAEKNPLYWDAEAVHLEKIVLTMIEDEHTELNMYENEELDWAGSPNSSIPPEAIPHLKERGELYIAPIAGTYCFKFNTKAPPFNSAKMRRAFACAINRKSLIDNILQANQLVAQALLPPCMRSVEREHSPFFSDGNRDEAVALFEEALEENGWTRETFPPITLIFSKSEKHQKTAQAVQQQWNHAFDIKINLQSYEWNIFLEQLAKHHYQVGGKSWISDVADPMTLLELYKFTNDSPLGGNNDTQWEDDDFVALLEAANHEIDIEKRFALLTQAEEILMHDMPIAPLYHSMACYLKKPYVHDVYLSKMCDLDFKYAYIRR